MAYAMGYRSFAAPRLLFGTAALHKPNLKHLRLADETREPDETFFKTSAAGGCGQSGLAQFLRPPLATD